MLFVQCFIVGIGFFIFMISVWNREAPKGIVEWLFIIASILVLTSWAIKY